MLRVLDVDMTDVKWTQASLPVKFGGLGIRDTASLAPSAFSASAVGSHDLITKLLPARLLHHTDPLIEQQQLLWKELAGTEDLPRPEVASRQSQRDVVVCKKKYELLLKGAESSQYDTARLKAAPLGGAWLDALPLGSVGTHLTDEETGVAIQIRLGPDTITPHTCAGCNAEEVGPGNEFHGLSCKNALGTRPRHEALNQIIGGAMRNLAKGPQLEPPGQVRDGTRKRPDGITTVSWNKGRPIAWDVTVTDSFCKSWLPRAAKEAGSNASRAEQDKIVKYKDIPNSTDFTPIAYETTGVPGPLTRIFINDLCKRLVVASGEPRDAAYLKQRISLTIQRGNACSYYGTIPHNRPTAVTSRAPAYAPPAFPDILPPPRSGMHIPYNMPPPGCVF